MHLMDFPPFFKKKNRQILLHFPFSIAITSLGEERANLSVFRTFDLLVLVWICRFPLPLDVWEGLRFVIVALPELFSYLFFSYFAFCKQSQGSTSKERILYPWERILSFRVEIIRTPSPPRPTPAQHLSFRVDPFSGGRHFFLLLPPLKMYKK